MKGRKNMPWLALGIGFGVGFVVGAIVGVIWTNIQMLNAFSR